MSAFFLQKISLFRKNVTFRRSNILRAVLDIFSLCSQFLQDKRVSVLVLQTKRPESDFWIAPNWPTIRKITMTSQFSDMTSSSMFLVFCVFLVNFSYWSKFHVNIITGSGVMTIFCYKGLSRNSGIRISPSEFCPKSWD